MLSRANVTGHSRFDRPRRAVVSSGERMCTILVNRLED